MHLALPQPDRSGRDPANTTAALYYHISCVRLPPVQLAQGNWREDAGSFSRRKRTMSETRTSDVLEREDFGDVTVLRVQVPMLRGDQATEALFEQTYSLVDDAGRSRLVLNLAGVEYFASMAIGKLVTLIRKVHSAGGRLVVCKLTRTLEATLQVTHLADLLHHYDDEQEAVRSFS
jgi:anti-sigma B factor antagonist